MLFSHWFSWPFGGALNGHLPAPWHLAFQKEFYLLSVLTFICAFCCWIIDQTCVFSFQFHALWHILSGLSIYTILLVECYALSKNSVIKYYGIIPYIYHPNAKKQLFRNKTKSD